MDFLKDEFEGIPLVVKDAALKQLEQAIRDARMAMTTEGTTLTYMAICAKIHNVVDFLARFRAGVEEQQG